jgi:hypothetical protein
MRNKQRHDHTQKQNPEGVIFVACVLTFWRGIVGEIGHYLRQSL